MHMHTNVRPAWPCGREPRLHVHGLVLGDAQGQDATWRSGHPHAMPRMSIREVNAAKVRGALNKASGCATSTWSAHLRQLPKSLLMTSQALGRL